MVQKKSLMEILYCIFLIIAIACYYYLYIRLPYEMAKKRHRDTTAWILIFIFITPLWGAILLYILGDNQDYR